MEWIRPATAWIKDVKDRTKFLISGANIKMKVSPKYRDPESGVKWAGRGMGRHGIASEKNWDKFPIEGWAVSEEV
jgi:hypothetical protein